MLMYPIQFESELFNGIDRVVAQVSAEHRRTPLHDVIAAIDAGLASDAKLAELLPHNRLSLQAGQVGRVGHLNKHFGFLSPQRLDNEGTRGDRSPAPETLSPKSPKTKKVVGQDTSHEH
jgi:hypothetical protein